MSNVATSKLRNRAKPWLWTALAVVVAFVFIRAGVQKLVGDQYALEPFDEFGWPLWLAYLTAIGEIMGAIALIIPVTRVLGGLFLTVIMIAAAFTNIANGHPDFLWVNAVLIAGSLLLTWQRHRKKSSDLPAGSA